MNLENASLLFLVALLKAINEYSRAKIEGIDNIGF